jgi:hypothetical protein
MASTFEMEDDRDPEEVFDNPLVATPDSDSRQKDFAASAAGGELAEYGEGDEKFSSSQIFQKLETEASVSLSPHPLPALACTLHQQPSQAQPTGHGSQQSRWAQQHSRCHRRRCHLPAAADADGRRTPLPLSLAAAPLGASTYI